MLRCGSHGPRPPWGQPATAKLPPSHRQATNKPPPSHQQANHQLTSPSSQGAENTSLRPARAVPLGPKGKATSAQAVGRGGLGERRSGHVPRHPGQSRPRQGLLDAHFLLPPNSGTLPKTEMRPVQTAVEEPREAPLLTIPAGGGELSAAKDQSDSDSTRTAAHGWRGSTRSMTSFRRAKAGVHGGSK